MSVSPVHISFLDKVVNVSASLLLGGLLFFAAYSMLETQFVTEVHQRSAQSVKNIDNIALDVRENLIALNDMGISDCSAGSLLSMRKQLFFSQYIKDIGFLVDDSLVCTTGLGVLPAPIYDMSPDFYGLSGASVWVNRKVLLFQHELSATIIRYEQFNAVIKQDLLNDLQPSKNKWELVVKHDGQLTHLAGQQGTYQAVAAAKSDSAYNVIQCSDLTLSCVAVVANYTDFWSQYHLALLTLSLFCFIVFLLCLFSFSQVIRKYRSLESRVLRGFSKDAFYCLYQPIVELKTGKIVGCEVLARYRDNEGDIYPDAFIPVIHALKKTWPFTQNIIHKAMSDIQQRARFTPGFKVNINFFAQDISSGNILQLLKYPPDSFQDVQLVIEVTEDQKLSNEHSSEVLSKLIDNGFQVAVDDFGTGYSNLGQIRDFNCHTLKIDRSFISEMEGGSIRSTLIPHIVDIAEKVGVDVVAEGIENSLQHKALLDLGIQYGQGYLFGKPMTLEELNTCLLTNSK